MEKKEHYRGNLPHFQKPGQWYFITCVLAGAMPKNTISKYSQKLETVARIYKYLWTNDPNGKKFMIARRDYFIALEKYRRAFESVLHNSDTAEIKLSKENNRQQIEKALWFWDGKRLKSHAWCIMPNHLHWVVSLFEKNEKGEPVYLQDILHSVKLYTARRINDNEGRKGRLWTHESFDTTIRNNRHFIKVVNYTKNNPVASGLVNNWKEWKGTYVEPDLEVCLL